MTIRFLVAAAAAGTLIAGSAHAEDPPPAPVAPVAPEAPKAAESATRHVNKVTDAAKAAFEKMDKVANSPVRDGLKDASGTINADMMGMPVSMKFTFKAPNAVRVEGDPSMQGPMQMAVRGAERGLRSMLGIFRPADEDEYDADVTKSEGGDVLTIVNFKEGAERGRTDFTLDANGLPVKGVSKYQVGEGAEKHEMKSETTLTWTKAGERYRLTKIETPMGGGGRGGAGGRGMGGGGGAGGAGGGKVTLTPTYTEIEKFAIATSWKTELEGGMAMTYESRISDLVVNGKKVEVAVPAPAGPRTLKSVKPTEEEDEDEDDDEDDGEDEDEDEDDAAK